MPVPRGDRRLAALDGLRGVAALVVLLSHVVMASVGAISATIVVGGDPEGLAWWFTRTPLAVLWAGPELVVVFFVLSGFVLTRALRDRPVPLAAFLAGRAVRLYLPVWVSLGVAALLVVLVPRAPGLAAGHDTGLWLDVYARPAGAEAVARDLALVRSDHVGQIGTLNGVLWSLRWEVLFSLALPFLMVFRRAIARLALPVVALSLVAVDVGSGTHPSLRYLPAFAIGMALALHEPRIRALRDELAGRGVTLGVAVAACLLSADLWLPGAVRATGPGGTLVLAGAALAVALPMLFARVERVLTRAPVLWLGSRSFSLYLMHLPVLLAFAYGLDGPGFGVLLATAVPASLLAAEVFHRAAERPCHALARAATAGLTARAARSRRDAVGAAAPGPAAAPAG